MYLLHKLKNKILFLKMLILLFLFAFLLSNFNVAISMTSEEISEKIKIEKEKLYELQKQINNKKKEIENLENSSNKIKEDLPKLQNEIEQIKKQIYVNSLIKKEKENILYIKELERKQNQTILVEALKSNYLDWKSNRYDIYNYLLHKDKIDEKKRDFYYANLVQTQLDNINILVTYINQINKEISEAQSFINSFEDQQKKLEERMKDLENKLNLLNFQTANNLLILNQFSSQNRELERFISFLTEEQKIAQERERQLLLQVQSTSSAGIGEYRDTFTNQNSTFTIFGRGRDICQGHGVGLSQWGAHGMASNGWSYQQILSFYYPGTQISSGYEDSIINVEGYGQMNIEDYVSGQGEILPPRARACGTPEQVQQNPKKYATNGCWPEEAIKAQVVAYRTYALFFTRNGTSICTSSRCQVYNPSNDTRWAVEETKGQVITFNGKIIEALYSAENSQGFGTANNDTIWQNYEGNATPVPYLRSVNDQDVATKPISQVCTDRMIKYNDWTYRSKDYSLSDLKNIFSFVVNNPTIFGPALSNFISRFHDNSVNYTGIRVERDPSLRVKKIYIYTDRGIVQSIGGYWFKYIWNIYVNKNNIKNQNQNFDYIYSQTYFFHLNN